MDTELLARLIAYAGLIAATIEYCEILKRRLVSRQLMAEEWVNRAVGLQGLARLFLTDDR
jgi:hypothetical protein